MKRLLYILLSAFFSFSTEALASEPLDSLTRSALSGKLNEYFEALRHESLFVQEQECDFLIESASDSLVRQFVAMTIYNHYMESKVMGAENVAVHVFDRWFKNGLIKMPDESSFLAGNIFAEFNRQSLIGRSAPQLSMEAADGRMIELFSDTDGSGKARVLFFYDSDCPKCKVESVLLRNMMSAGTYPVELCLIYTGDNREKWISHQEKYLKMDYDALHLWDPQLNSDFQRKYGVLSTPAVFVVDASGKIAGRRLDTSALKLILDDMFTQKELDYGSDESVALYDGLLGAGEHNPSAEEINKVADFIASSLLDKGDTLMFRQLSGDLLYYLVSRRGEGVKEGLGYLVDRYILSRPDIWKSADDSLKVIGLAQITNDMLGRAKPGTEIPALKVPALLLRPQGAKETEVRLDAMKGKRNIIIFYTEGCPVCDAEKKAAEILVKSSKGVRAAFVNMDKILSSDASKAIFLLDAFDLSSLPFIVETDRNGKILRRYVSLND